MFLKETKTNVEYVKTIFRSTNPTHVYGVGAYGTNGELGFFCWGPFLVDVVCQNKNYVLCKIEVGNGKKWYLLFLYGESQEQYRQHLWDELSHLISHYDTYLIIGDTNQVDSYEDKLGGTILIRGWDKFNEWK